MSILGLRADKGETAASPLRVRRAIEDQESSLQRQQRSHLQTADAAARAADFRRARLMLEIAGYDLDLLEITHHLKTMACHGTGGSPIQQNVASFSVSAMSLFDWHKQLFPPEAMLCLSGPSIGDDSYHIDQAVRLEPDQSSSVHFVPSPQSIYAALKRFEYFGYRLRAVIHSHPGRGPSATQPSQQDKETQERLERSYRSVGLVMSEDGYFRAFRLSGDAFELTIRGERVEVLDERERLYRLVL